MTRLVIAAPLEILSFMACTEVSIRAGKDFLLMHPPSHPDSIGVSHGHPQLTSFLGVPLS